MGAPEQCIIAWFRYSAEMELSQLVTGVDIAVAQRVPQETCPRDPIGTVPRDAGMLRHAFTDSAWAALCRQEGVEDVGLICTAKNAISLARIREGPLEAEFLWGLLVLVDKITLFGQFHELEAILQAVQRISGSSDERKQVMSLQLCAVNTDMLNSEKWKTYQLRVAKKPAPGSSVETKVKIMYRTSTDHKVLYNSSMILLNPHVVKQLAVQRIDHCAWEDWIQSAIRYAADLQTPQQRWAGLHAGQDWGTMHGCFAVASLPPLASPAEVQEQPWRQRREQLLY